MLAALTLPGAALAVEQRVDENANLDGKVLLSPSAERVTTVTAKSDAAPIGPGTTATRDVIVQNRTTEAIRFDVAISQVVGSSAEDVVEVRHGVREGAAAWASIEREQVTVRSGGTLRMPVTIRIPKDVTPGSKSFAVTITQQPSGGQTQGAGVTPVFRQVAIFVVDLPGDAPVSGSLHSLSVRSDDAARANGAPAQRVFIGRHDLELSFEYRNDGERILTPQGTVEVRDLFGRTVRTYPVERFTVYPAGANAVTMPLSDLPVAGAFTAVVKVTSDAGTDDRKLGRIWLSPVWLLAVLAVLVAGTAALLVRWALGRRHAAGGDDYDEWDEGFDDDDGLESSAADGDDAWDDDEVPGALR